MNESGVSAVRDFLKLQGLDAFLISDKEDQFYVANYSGDDGFVVVSAEEIFIVTDARFFSQIKVECPDCVIVDVAQTSLAEFLAEKFPKVGIESGSLLTKDYLSLVDKGVETVDGDLVIKKARMFKSAAEIDLLKQGAVICDRVFEHIVDFMKVGQSEIAVANEIERFGKSLGAEKLSFDTIVASGVRSAFPHGGASSKVIEDGDVVTLDFGFVVDGYFSDITRTVLIGEASEEVKKVYGLVQKAEDMGIRFAPMVETFGDLDRVVRGFINDTEYGPFIHGTGHGLGLVCHDYPIIRTSNNDQLESEIVFTVEPGIYLPNKFGVRIEDDVYKDEAGNMIRLTNSATDLIEIK